MTTHSSFPINHLVLRLEGGQRDGELIPVSTPKCFLGMDNNSRNDKPKCAIFRGPNGAAVRSYGDDILVNGAPASVHWLKEGDRIEFPNAMAVEVTQLGWMEEQGQDQPTRAQTIQESYQAAVQPLEEAAPIQSFIETPSVTEAPIETSPIETSPIETPQVEAPQVEAPQVEAPQVEAPQVTEEQVFAPQQEAPVEAATASEVENVLTPSEEEMKLEKAKRQIEELEAKLAALASAATVVDEPAPAAPAQFESTPIEMTQFADVQPEAPTISPEPEVPQAPEAQVEMPVETPVAETAGLESFLDYAPGKNEQDVPQDLGQEPETAPETEADQASVAQEQVDARNAELERVFGSAFAEPKPEPTPEPELTTQTTNEQYSESFETKSHSPDVDAASFVGQSIPEPTESETPDYVETIQAYDATPAETQESVEPVSESFESPTELSSSLEAYQTETSEPVENADSFQSGPLDSYEPGSLASQLIDEVASEINGAPTVESSDSAAEPETEADAANSSVADLLGRLKAEGKWDGVDDDSDQADSYEAPIESYSEPEPVAEPVPAVESEPVDDVEDYMSQLLSRMRGGSDQPAASKPVEVKAPKPEAKTASKESFVPPENPLKPEEFKPARKAQKIESLNAMRELANSTARTAVKKSEDRNRKELGYLQLGIATGAVLMSLYYFLISSKALFDTSFLVGVVCVATAAFLGYRYHTTAKQDAADGGSKAETPAEQKPEETAAV